MVVQPEGGDLFAAMCNGQPVEAIVNPVNCAGTMGRGLALDFKKRFPHIAAPYAEACQFGWLVPGRVRLVAATDTDPAIALFPTKNHWRNPSRIDWIAEGLKSLIVELERSSIATVAIPALGCGLGGLDWAEVLPVIESAFADSAVTAVVFPPAGAATTTFVG